MAPSWSRRVVCAMAFGGWSLTPGDARGGDPSNISLSYEVPPGCPPRAELTDALRTRVDERWVRGSDPRTFDIRVTRLDDGAYSGRLAITQPGHAPRVREIRAESCRAVVTSMAVFLAIALDPASEPEPAKAAPSIEGDIEAPDRTATPEPPIVEKNARGLAPAAPKPRWIWSAGYQATYLHVPDAAWGGRVHAELARAYDRRLLSPALRASWGFSNFSTFPDRGGEAEFSLKTARLEGCARFRTESLPILAAACAGVDVGALAGRTPALVGSSREATRWIAAAMILRAAWELTAWLTVGLEASVHFPLERTSFMLGGPPRLVYRAPPVLFGGGAGLGVTARFR